MKTSAVLCLLVSVACAKILEREDHERIIPADQLRDFPGLCFAATSCKTFKPGDSWPLTPFCGESTCLGLLNKQNRTVLVEKVKDCGPLVDLEATPGCQLVKEKTDTSAAFPGCCPVYDCEEGVEVKYILPKPKKAPKSE